MDEKKFTPEHCKQQPGESRGDFECRMMGILSRACGDCYSRSELDEIKKQPRKKRLEFMNLKFGAKRFAGSLIVGFFIYRIN